MLTMLNLGKAFTAASGNDVTAAAILSVEKSIRTTWFIVRNRDGCTCLSDLAHSLLY